MLSSTRWGHGTSSVDSVPSLIRDTDAMTPVNVLPNVFVPRVAHPSPANGTAPADGYSTTTTPFIPIALCGAQ